MSESVDSENSIQFSLVEGGPFHSLLGRLGLLGEDRLPTWRTAFVLALLAWMPPAVLAIAQTILQADYAGWGLFKDQTVYTRYLVAIIAMVVTERAAEQRISLLINQFMKAHLLDAESREKYKAIVARADRRASLPLVEGILLVLALTWSWMSFYYISVISVGGWEESTRGGDTHLSWAGTVAELLSNPVFLFLVLRWFWRFLVWTALLLNISRLPLRLTAMHPDRSGGLGFLTLFPDIFTGFVFALSCVISSSLLKSMALMPVSSEFIWLVICGWVLLIILILFAPLLFFSTPMMRAREKALVEYGKLAQAHHHAFRAAWIKGRRRPEEILGSPDPSSAADLNAIVQAVLDMRIVPLNLAAFLQVLIAAVIPFLVVVISQIPLAELLSWFVGALF